MNGFSFIGDILHLSAIFILIGKILKSKSCAGISGRSQMLFALVYTTRYLDLIGGSNYWYLVMMKIIFIAASYMTVFLIFVVYRRTYQYDKDIFFTEILISLTFLKAIWINHEFNLFTPLEICWTFSIDLEAVAIVPQFFMIYQKRQMDKSMFFYLLTLGLYRTFYIFNWVYRYYTENHYDLIADGAGILYTFLYIMAAAEVLFNGIKITDGEKESHLKSNIYFISNKEPLTEHLISNNEQLDTEKREVVIPQIEKV